VGQPGEIDPVRDVPSGGAGGPSRGRGTARGGRPWPGHPPVSGFPPAVSSRPTTTRSLWRPTCEPPMTPRRRQPPAPRAGRGRAGGSAHAGRERRVLAADVSPSSGSRQKQQSTITRYGPAGYMNAQEPLFAQYLPEAGPGAGARARRGYPEARWPWIRWPWIRWPGERRFTVRPALAILGAGLEKGRAGYAVALYIFSLPGLNEMPCRRACHQVTPTWGSEGTPSARAACVMRAGREPVRADGAIPLWCS
jgi:hypothetical protein